jgi:hypothetical protein
VFSEPWDDLKEAQISFVFHARGVTAGETELGRFRIDKNLFDWAMPERLFRVAQA